MFNKNFMTDSEMIDITDLIAKVINYMPYVFNRKNNLNNDFFIIYAK